MIVKAMTTLEGSWRFYDEASEVQQCVWDRLTLPEFVEHPCTNEILLEDGTKIHEEYFLHRTNTSQISLINFQSRGKCFNLYVENPAYLLNDSGKTIERLN